MSPYRTPESPAPRGHPPIEGIGIGLLWFVVLLLAFGAWCVVLDLARLRRNRRVRRAHPTTLSELRKWTRSS